LRIEGLLIAALVTVTGNAAGDARQDYVLNCMGCHMMDGAGAPPAIPRLKDRVGYYLTTAQGRAYLTQVPGAANSLLDDLRLAQVLNWIVTEFAGASLPGQWTPYDAVEVAKYRATRPDDIDAVRHAVTAAIEKIDPAAGAW
jgi:mono/diheme cytochrome c family protein